MKRNGLYLLLVCVAVITTGCAASVEAAMVAPLPTQARTAVPTATPTLINMVATPTPYDDYRFVWPLGTEFNSTYDLEQTRTYSMNFGEGVAVSIENRSKQVVEIDEFGLLHLLKFASRCPNLPKFVIVSGHRDAEAMQEVNGSIVVIGNDTESMNIGLIAACKAAGSGYPDKYLRDIDHEGWQKAVHITAVLLGDTYDQYVSLAEAHGADTVACGDSDCNGYKAIALDLYNAHVDSIVLQSQP